MRADIATGIALAIRRDGWGNVYSGIGIEGKDKRKGGYWCPDYLTYGQTKAIWQSSAIAARMVSTWPNEMLRKGWCLTSDDADLNKKVEDRAQELGADGKFIRAMEFQRAHGGGALLLGINDGQGQDMPLNLDGIISFDFITLLEHKECIPYKYYDDPGKAKYKEPAIYQIGSTPTGQGMTGKVTPITYVHESRLLIFDGIRVTTDQTGSNFGWGDPIFVRANQALADFEAACAAIGILVTDFAPNVFKMKGLLGIVAAEGAEAVTSFKTRMQALALGKSIANTAVVDADDDYKRETVNVTGLADLWDRLCVALAAIADMPVTLLMGQSPKGLGNEGESDLRFFYDRVFAKCGKDLKPQVEYLVKCIIKALKLTPPPTWEVTFHPLYQPSAKEEAETRAIQAGTDEKYIINSVYSSEEIRKSRGDGTTLTTHIEADEELEPATDEEKATLRDPGAKVEPAGAAGADKGATVAGQPTPAGEAVQATAFNGTQISGAMEIVKAVINEEIPRESGAAILTIMFPITMEQANAMLGPEGFKPKKEDPPPMMPGMGGPPGMPGKTPSPAPGDKPPAPAVKLPADA